MRIAMFYHSLRSDWNHGNAHFLRGIATELLARGHDVTVLEPADSWSRRNLVSEHGDEAADAFRRYYPRLDSTIYDPSKLNLTRAIGDADLVIVHEWNTPELVAAIGQHRVRHGKYRLLFHDTHHRSVSEPGGMSRYDLSAYDGVLAFGETVRQRYLTHGWTRAAWTWHEAADERLFRPLPRPRVEADLVWIGNWGDEERTAELHEFLLEPVKRLGISATVYGVRYPDAARAALEAAGITYGGYLPNYLAPQVFARHRITVHIPRRPYARMLPGIPTIRVFEALACGIPLISAPWDDSEHLFSPGHDFVAAHDGAEMQQRIEQLLGDEDRARDLAQHGRHTILDRHTCAHRVDELMDIAHQLGLITGERATHHLDLGKARAHA